MLTRWDPFREMMSWRDMMDRMMEEGFRSTPLRSGTMGGGVVMDVSETEDAYCIKAELPGVKPDDVNITANGSTLTIQGETRDDRGMPQPEQRDAKAKESPGDGAQRAGREPSFHMRERRFGRFMRSITLPPDARMDKTDAQFENGVLTLVVPKAEETKPRQIKIRAGESRPAIEGQARDSSQQPTTNA